jgi:hypothetical protein
VSPRRALIALAFCGALLASGARTPAAAQLTPADSAAVLLATAARFAREGRADVADALYRYITGHFSSTPAALEARAHLEVSGSGGPAAGSGRVELEVWGALYGLWLGVAVPAAFGAEGPEPYGLGLLVGGPAGFLAGRTFARGRDLSEGQARAITLGGSWGSWQGVGWTNVLDIGEGYQCDFDVCSDNGATQERFAGMVLGGLAGIGVGAALSRRPISAGAATTVNFGALWGTWFGFAGGFLAGLEEDNLLAASLVGGDAGLLGAAVMAPRWKLSRSRARLVSIYGVMGGLAGLGVDLLAQPEDDKVGVAIPLAGSVIALLVGSGVTRDYDSTHRPGEAGELAPGALLSLRDGEWSVGVPLPTPVRVRQDRPGGTRRVPTLGIPLLSARFR